MSITESSEVLWLSAASEMSLQELSDYSGMSQAEILHYVEEGAIVPADSRASPLVFSQHYQVTIQAARRLRDDFELDTKGLAVAISLLERIHDLEKKLHA